MTKLNIVVPMAGAGSRFTHMGYKEPKPLIKIHSVPLIRWVITNLKPKCSHQFIFICQKQHLESYPLQSNLKKWAPGCEVISTDGLTEGAACTVLLARDAINNSDPLMIANSDQYINKCIDDYLSLLKSSKLDGLIMTMTANDPKWSFVGLDSCGYVNKVVEKKVISNEATVGIYNFKRGIDYIESADAMISKNLRVNGEFYVAPVYNELIKIGKKIGIANIGKAGAGMYGLGTPYDLEYFASLNFSKNIAQKL